MVRLAYVWPVCGADRSHERPRRPVWSWARDPDVALEEGPRTTVEWTRGVCGTARVERVRALGADHVVDYTREDFTASGKRYELILDVLGRRSFRDVRGALTGDGVYLLASFKTPHLAWAIRTRFGSGPRVRCVMTGQTRDDLLEAVYLAREGVLTSRVDRTFPFEEAAEAHRYAESKGRSGTVVLTVR